MSVIYSVVFESYRSKMKRKTKAAKKYLEPKEKPSLIYKLFKNLFT